MKYLYGLLVFAAMFSFTAWGNRVFAATLTLTPSNLTLYETEIKTVQVSGGELYYIGTNARPDIVGADIKDGILTVRAHLPGEGSVSVCSYISSALTCSAISISVLKKAETPVADATIKFSKSNVNVDIGQTVYITVEGSRSGGYYVSANSNPEAVYTGISGNIITVKGQKIGGTNITVCQMGGTCGNFYAYVPANPLNTSIADLEKPPVPVLSAFYMASNNVGNAFLGKGSVLTFKFNTSVDISQHTFKVGGQIVHMSGSGSGPYGGSYTVTGSETFPLPVSISFSTDKGLTGQASFTVGEKSQPLSASDAKNFGTFVSYLRKGSSGSEVLALQNLLKKLGVYSGPLTGSFGPLTEDALKKYQKTRGIDPVGYVGPGTRAQLNKDRN